ncbi:MAG: transporter substrate-binding domain-containing protein [Draconibacterium sp.]
MNLIIAEPEKGSTLVKNFQNNTISFWQNDGFNFLKIFLLIGIILTLMHSTASGHDDLLPHQLHDTIVVGAEPDYPPYCSLDENGNPEGFAIDVFNAAAKAAGLNVKYKIGLWLQIKQYLTEGKIDALPVVGRTPEREDIFDFTLSYLTLKGAAFVLKGENSIKTLSDLKNKRILVMKGDNSHEFVTREKISEHVYTTNTFDEAFEKLVNKEGDVVIIQHIIGLKLIERMKLQRKVVPLPIDLGNFTQEFCMAVTEGDKQLLNRLNEGLSIIIANDTFRKIHEKWFGPVIKEELSAADIFKVILLVVVPLFAIMILLWIVFLRNEVKRRTERIYQEIAEHQHTMVNLKHQQILVNESEQQIRLLLNSTAEGIYGIDNNGRCTFINHSGIEILGYKNAEELIGHGIHDLIHHTKPDGTPNDVSECLIHNTVLKGEKAVNDNDFFWKADNTVFLAEFSSFPIVKEGIVTGAVVTFRDITERKKSEEELLQLKNELEIKVAERTTELEEKVQKLAKSQQAMLFMVEDLNRITTELKAERRKLEISNKDLDAFTYSVSHDLRAPLRAINGFSGFLIEDYYNKLDDEGRRYINIIKENATRMDHLINDMLMLSRISRAERKSETVNFNELIEKIIEDNKNDFKNQDYEIVIAELPEIKCDKGLLKQVWTNLISNAFKYTSKSDFRKIEIGVDENAHETIFYVKDSGAGFDPKYVHKLFGVFQRLHTDSEFEGTGVGLAIVKQIIQLHGGRVFADSLPGKGATFYFTLPKI